MDAKKLNSEIRSQLDNIKNLFSKFVAVANQINDVHKSKCDDENFKAVNVQVDAGDFKDANQNISGTSTFHSKMGLPNVQFSDADNVCENFQETNAVPSNIEANTLVTKLRSTDKFQSKIENSLVEAELVSANIQFSDKFNQNISGTSTFHSKMGNSLVMPELGLPNVQFSDADNVCENFQETNAVPSNIEANTSVTKLRSTDKFKIENSLVVSESANLQISGVDNVYGNEYFQRINTSQSQIEDRNSVVATKFASGSSTCSNVMETTHKDVNQVMGYDLPDQSTFIDNDHFQSMLNQIDKSGSIVNYVYYLHNGSDVNHTIDVPPDSDWLNILTEVETPIAASMNEPYDPVDVVGYEIASLDYPVFGLSDDLTENENSSIITDTRLGTAVTDLFDVPVVSENFVEVNHRSPSEEVKDTTPWIIDIQRRRGCDDTKMFVPSSNSKHKRHCCTYCHKRFSKFVRHLENVHKDEAAVLEFRSLPIGSKARSNIIAMLRKKGDFEWNEDFELNRGELIPCRLPAEKFERKAPDFEACPKCLGKYAKSGLSRHFKICSDDCLKGERSVKVLSRSTEGRVHPNACDMLVEKIIPKVQDPEVAQAFRFDWLIIEFGNDLCVNYFRDHQMRIIRDKLRDAGKLLLAAKSISPEITDLSSLFQVKHCNVVIEAVRKVSKYDQKTNTYGSPTTATILVTLIKAICDLLIIERMKQDDQEQENVAQRFLKVFTKDAKLKINKSAYLAMENAKFDRDEDIPSTFDVGRFADYLDGERNKFYAELTQKFSFESWKKLSELTLASILVFNRKRVGESGRIPLKAFTKRILIAEQRDKLVDDAVPESTSQLIKSKLRIGGKLDRKVPVLLQHGFDECLELLVAHREDAGIPDENTYLFALPSSASGALNHVDAGIVIRNTSNACAAENPGSLRGTKLRKHLASMCATMNLSDNEVTNVANFMGHDDQIHRNVYRHNTLQREVTDITEILQKCQGKNVNVTKISKESNDANANRKRKTNCPKINTSEKKRKKQPPARPNKTCTEANTSEKKRKKRPPHRHDQIKIAPKPIHLKKNEKNNHPPARPNKNCTETNTSAKKRKEQPLARKRTTINNNF